MPAELVGDVSASPAWGNKEVMYIGIGTILLILIIIVIVLLVRR
jgi:hypothetical protein